MQIIFTKNSDQEHTVQIQRKDGSNEQAVLNTRSFLNHDLAHLAVELEVPLALGYWGSVAAGSALDGMAIKGADIVVAESLAGPVQGLIRDDADSKTFLDLLSRIQPELVTEDLANRIFERCRQLKGHWRATPFGDLMILEWPYPKS